MNMVAQVEGGLLDSERIAQSLRTTIAELADSAGLSLDDVRRPERLASEEVQTRLREIVDLLEETEPRWGSLLMAYAWLRSDPLSGWGGRTAMDLVREGNARYVHDYLEAADAGIFA